MDLLGIIVGLTLMAIGGLLIFRGVLGWIYEDGGNTDG